MSNLSRTENTSSKLLPLLFVLAGMMILRLVAAASTDLVPDESYYWLWSQHPALGYYDHPPMVAWWIGAFGTLGKAAILVRLPFILSFLALSWVVYDTAKVLFDASVGRRAVLWLNACLLLSIGSFVATPDPPSVLMWACGLWALARLQISGQGWWWLVFGVFAGLGFEAKYTNLFIGVGVLSWFALDTSARKHLFTLWPWLGGVVALVLMAPNLIWNAQHEGLSIAKQFGRIEAGHFTVRYLIEFLISQPFLLNPLIFVFIVIGIATWCRTRSDPRLTLLIALPLPLLAYFLVHVFHDRIQGNWPAPIYPGLVILAAAMAEKVGTGWLRRLRDLAAPLGIALSALILIYVSLGRYIPQMSGAAGLSQGWDSLAARLEAQKQASGAEWIATTNYNLQGELSYHMKAPVIGMAERKRYGWQGTDPTGLALIVVAGKAQADLSRCFADITEAGTLSRLNKPSKTSDVRLYTGMLKQSGCDIQQDK